IDRDVVVDEEDDTRAAVPRIADVVDDPRNRKPMEIAAAHLDDRAEAAVVGAAPRGLDDIDRAPEQRVSREDASRAVRRLDRAFLDGRDRSRRVALEDGP